jgi:hypothetical protein
VESFILKAGGADIEAPELTVRDRLAYAREQMSSTFKKVFPYILIGVGIGAVIHNAIPKDWVMKALGENNPFGVVIATAIGIPMYADIFGTNSGCGSPMVQGRAARRNTLLHDGRHCAVAAVHDNAAQGDQAKAAGPVYSYMRYRHNCRRLSV